MSPHHSSHPNFRRKTATLTMIRTINGDYEELMRWCHTLEFENFRPRPRVITYLQDDRFVLSMLRDALTTVASQYARLQDALGSLKWRCSQAGLDANAVGICLPSDVITRTSLARDIEKTREDLVHATSSLDGIKLQVKKCEAWLLLGHTRVRLNLLRGSLGYMSMDTSSLPFDHYRASEPLDSLRWAQN